jgi:hypothetical protein
MGVAAAKQIAADTEVLGTDTRPGQFWRVVKTAHIRGEINGSESCPDQEVDSVLVEQERQCFKPAMRPQRLWLRVISSRDAAVCGWSAVHDVKTGTRKLEPITETEKHALDIAALLRSAQQTAAAGHWDRLLFCDAQHVLVPTISPVDPNQACACAACGAVVQPESATVTCSGGCAYYTLCMSCAAVRAGKQDQANQVASDLANSGARALHNLCVVQGLGHLAVGAIVRVALGGGGSGGGGGSVVVECCARCRQSVERETPIVRCCGATAVCLPCGRAIVERQRALNAGLAKGQQLQQSLTELQITCLRGHIRHQGTVVDAALQQQANTACGSAVVVVVVPPGSRGSSRGCAA